MKKQVYLVSIAKDYQDWLNKAKGGITIAVMSEEYPSKDSIRQLLTATLEAEMFKQHLPAQKGNNEKRNSARAELKKQYVDFLDSVNNTRYVVKQLTK